MNQKTSLAMAGEPTPKTPEGTLILYIAQELLHSAQRGSSLAETRLGPLLGQHRPEFPLQPEYFLHAEYFNSLERLLRDIDSHLKYTSDLIEACEL